MRMHWLVHVIDDYLDFNRYDECSVRYVDLHQVVLRCLVVERLCVCNDPVRVDLERNVVGDYIRQLITFRIDAAYLAYGVDNVLWNMERLVLDRRYLVHVLHADSHEGGVVEHGRLVSVGHQYLEHELGGIGLVVENLGRGDAASLRIDYEVAAAFHDGIFVLAIVRIGVLVCSLQNAHNSRYRGILAEYESGIVEYRLLVDVDDGNGDIASNRHVASVLHSHLDGVDRSRLVVNRSQQSNDSSGLVDGVTASERGVQIELHIIGIVDDLYVVHNTSVVFLLGVHGCSVERELLGHIGVDNLHAEFAVRLVVRQNSARLNGDFQYEVVVRLGQCIFLYVYLDLLGGNLRACRDD